MRDRNDCGMWTKDRQCLVPVDKLTALPLYHRETIPESYLDAMGHMNVRWYMTLFDKSVWRFFKSMGLNETYYIKRRMGVFALKHFIQYFSEVKAGDSVALRIRLLGCSEKRFHFINFMLDETSGNLSAVLEALGTHADLTQRKSCPMPADIRQAFESRITLDRQLDWEAPVSGVMGV